VIPLTMMFDNYTNLEKIRFAIYAVNAGLLIFKLFFVALSTGFVRERKKVDAGSIACHRDF
jgi:hypothetical protein